MFANLCGSPQISTRRLLPLGQGALRVWRGKTNSSWRIQSRNRDTGRGHVAPWKRRKMSFLNRGEATMAPSVKRSERISSEAKIYWVLGLGNLGPSRVQEDWASQCRLPCQEAQQWGKGGAEKADGLACQDLATGLNGQTSKAGNRYRLKRSEGSRGQDGQEEPREVGLEVSWWHLSI